MNDPEHSFFVETVFGGQLGIADLARDVLGADLHDQRVGQFCGIGTFASDDLLRGCPGPMAITPDHALRMQPRGMRFSRQRPAFEYLISGVGSVRSEPQVTPSLVQDTINFVGADFIIPPAGRIVTIRAVVTDGLVAGGPVASGNPPCESVGTASLSLEDYPAVATVFQRAGCNPTLTDKIGSTFQTRDGALARGTIPTHRDDPQVSRGAGPGLSQVAAGHLRVNYISSLRVRHRDRRQRDGTGVVKPVNYPAAFVMAPLYYSIPKCLELSENLMAYRRGLPALDGCQNHQQAGSATDLSPCVGPQYGEIRVDRELDPIIRPPRPSILLSQGEARPGIVQGQHWGRSR